jgi:hypothetical protein
MSREANKRAAIEGPPGEPPAKRHNTSNSGTDKSAPKIVQNPANRAGRKCSAIFIMWAEKNVLFQGCEGVTPRPVTLDVKDMAAMSQYVKHRMQKLYESLTLEERHNWGTEDYQKDVSFTHACNIMLNSMIVYEGFFKDEIRYPPMD